MEYVIGIDGGGTKTILRVVSLDGSFLTEIMGGPSNIQASSILKVSKMLSDLLDSALYMKGLKKEECKYLCMGAAGVDGIFEKELFEAEFRSYGIVCPIYITNDSETMLAESVGMSEGIVVISGTGSIAYGRDKSGKEFRSGGWGHIIGDEGSGYWIAIEAIKAAVRYSDSRAEKTILLERLLKKLGFKEARDILNYIYNSDNEKSEIAALAVVVDEAYKSGDKVARSILLCAAKELFVMFDAVAAALHFKEDSFTVVAGGSVFSNNEFVYNTFCDYISEKYSGSCVIKSLNRAADGAVRIALNMMSKG
ncbi:MAG: BadF/BadG/BcrA/BcrD ATPase family protein [Lutisporaceae bacterium]